MIRVVAHHILSPLGDSTAANLQAVRNGATAIRQWNGRWQLPQPFMASLFSESQMAQWPCGESHTPFEAMAIASVSKAIAMWRQQAGPAMPRLDDGRTVLVLSTTKGNIGLLDQLTDERQTTDPQLLQRLSLGHSAEVIAKAVGIPTMPIVVDNACISGASAIVFATRLLRMGRYDHAVVCGAERQSRFIVSGFQSLKALSSQVCRPFDIDRTGLNLGEAAATVILSRTAPESGWHVVAGAVRNDAHHISAPSMSAEGAWRALESVKSTAGVDSEQLAFLSTHGTATMFNDQMEAVAIDRAGQGQVPVNAVKANFGHTMGACGVLETVLSMAAIDAGIILPTKNFAELGVSRRINVTTKEMPTCKFSFIKMLSGFGGVNVALFMSKQAEADEKNEALRHQPVVRHSVHLSEKDVTVDGVKLAVTSMGKALVTELYKKTGGDYPRFYKMDLLCRIGLVATQLLLKAEETTTSDAAEHRAVVIVGRSGSIHADLNYLTSIMHADDFFPSPERFVYTLPNIVTGEIAMRYHYHGETSFYLLPTRDASIVSDIVQSAFLDPDTTSVIGGWIDCETDNRFEAELSILE